MVNLHLCEVRFRSVFVLSTLDHYLCEVQYCISTLSQYLYVEKCRSVVERNSVLHICMDVDLRSMYCSLSLWRVARGSKRMFLELIHGFFIT
jgi:hypothetical protein